MTKDEAARLVHNLTSSIQNAVNKLVDDTAPASGNGVGKAPNYPAAQADNLMGPNADREKLYQWLKGRLLDDLRVDPVFVKLLANVPEMVVEIEPRVVTLDGNASVKGRVAKLIAAGWFDQSRTTGAARAELKRTGADPGGGSNLSTALGDFVRDGFLVRDGDAYAKAPGVKVTQRELVTT